MKTKLLCVMIHLTFSWWGRWWPSFSNVGVTWSECLWPPQTVTSQTHFSNYSDSRGLFPVVTHRAPQKVDSQDLESEGQGELFQGTCFLRSFLLWRCSQTRLALVIVAVVVVGSCWQFFYSAGNGWQVPLLYNCWPQCLAQGFGSFFERNSPLLFFAFSSST